MTGWSMSIGRVRPPTVDPFSGLLKLLGCSVAMLALAGCTGGDEWLWIFNPNGPLASWSVYYLVVDVLLLLIVIVPATAVTLWALIRYRRGGKGTYDPAFTHSYLLEAVVWGVPFAVVVVLSYFSYQGAYAVAPYDPGVLEDHPATQDSEPLEIDVVTTDWQWLFIYPKQDVALANKLVLPIDRQINMRLTSASVTNDFYILKLVGQIYVMPGMRTKRKFLVERTGEYTGYSTEFSGPGFAWMDYPVSVVKPARFDERLRQARAAGEPLTYERFEAFAEPLVNTGNRTNTFKAVEPGLFEKIIKKVKAGELMHRVPERLTEDMESELFKRNASE